VKLYKICLFCEKQFVPEIEPKNQVIFLILLLNKRVTPERNFNLQTILIQCSTRQHRQCKDNFVVLLISPSWAFSDISVLVTFIFCACVGTEKLVA
jgi:hypothetical protein